MVSLLDESVGYERTRHPIDKNSCLGSQLDAGNLLAENISNLIENIF